MNPQDEAIAKAAREAKARQKPMPVRGLTPLPPDKDDRVEPDTFQATEFTPSYWLQKIERKVSAIHAIMLVFIVLTLVHVTFSVLGSVLGFMGSVVRAVPSP